MTFGRCVVKKVVPHNEFVQRIRKSLYFGEGTSVEEMQLSLPLASYASELFSKSHKDYSLNRLDKIQAGRTQASPCSLIMALIFLERLNVTDPGYVRRITPQELFIVSMMISTKFYAGYDEEIYLSDWAAEGNMSEERLKKLEIEFLCAINWNIYISNEEFFNKLTDIEKTVAKREGLRRGWLTYTELTQTMPSMKVTKFLLNALLHHITVMLVSYAAGVLTIVGAFFLASQIPGHILHRSKTEAARSTSSSNTTSDLINSMHMETSNEIAYGELKSIANRTSMNTVIERHNATCAALNVEAELTKLEKQYEKEQIEEETRNRNNEIKNVSYLLVPLQQSQIPLQSEEQQHKWLSFKEMYSDKNDNANQINLSSPSSHTNEIPKYFINCIKDIKNCTSTLFWQMLSSTQQSNVHLPLLWFKFI